MLAIFKLKPPFVPVATIVGQANTPRDYKSSTFDSSAAAQMHKGRGIKRMLKRARCRPPVVAQINPIVAMRALQASGVRRNRFNGYTTGRTGNRRINSHVYIPGLFKR